MSPIPRNPSGFIQRKVENEQELITKLRKKFSNYTIRGVQIDLFDMRQQLEFVTTTDIVDWHARGRIDTLDVPSETRRNNRAHPKLLVRSKYAF